VLEFNAPAVPDAVARLGRAMETDDPVRALIELERSLHLPMALRDVGMPNDGIARAVAQATANPYANPREVDAASLTELIERAWRGAGAHAH
jgi:maleylacetate reductase